MRLNSWIIHIESHSLPLLGPQSPQWRTKLLPKGLRPQPLVVNLLMILKNLDRLVGSSLSFNVVGRLQPRKLIVGINWVLIVNIETAKYT